MYFVSSMSQSPESADSVVLKAVIKRQSSCFLFGKARFQLAVRRPYVATKDFHKFSQSLQEKLGIETQIFDYHVLPDSVQFFIDHRVIRRCVVCKIKGVLS